MISSFLSIIINLKDIAHASGGSKQDGWEFIKPSKTRKATTK